jgi:hypothetical protein
MNKNFLTIQTNVGNEVIDTSSAFKTIIKPYINARYFQILRQINWQNINPDYSFNTVDGTQDYVLPNDFYKPISVRDSTNGTELAETDLQTLINNYPDAMTDEGTVERYVIMEQAVQNQPTSATAVSIVSSSASDTTQTVLVRGISGGVETTEEETLTGTTPAVTTATFTRIIGISKSATTTGYITVTATVTLAILPPETLESRYKIMRLHYVPSAVLAIVAPYTIKPSPMSDDMDYPILDIADLIEIGAKADAWRYKKMFAKANVFEAQFTTGLAEYVWDKENQPNKITQFSPNVYNKDNLY